MWNGSRVSAESAENLNEQYGTQGVKVQTGEGGLIKVVLSTPAGRYGLIFFSSPPCVPACICMLCSLQRLINQIL